jgi:hypothetical protein
LKLFLFLAVFLVIGAPLVAYLWNAINEVVAGQYGRLAVALPLLAVFIAFLVFFGRLVQRRAGGP